MSNYSDAQVESLIYNIYPKMIGLTPHSGGLVSQTYSFQNGDMVFVFQIGGKKENYEKELFISQQYREVLPVREVLDVRETDDGIAYCISKYINGKPLFDLSDRERRKIVNPTMDALAKMAQIAIPSDRGYGRFDANGYARYANWLDFILAIYNDTVYDWSDLTKKGFDDSLVRKAIDEIQKSIDYVQIEHACFGHGDIGAYNVIAHNGQIAGFIDCQLAFYGDPLYDMANLLFWDEKKLCDLTEAVIQRFLTDEKNKRKVYCYALRIALEEIYTTVILDGIGYDVKWVSSRLGEILKNGLCHTTLTV